MKAIRTILLILTAIISVAHAKIHLPTVEDRVILLVDLSTAKLDENSLVLPHDATVYQFVLNRLWLQATIFGPGICTGIPDDDPKSAETRINEVQRTIKKKSQGLMLVELVWPKESTHWIVSYIKVFDTMVEYPRYFPKLESYDAILLPKGFTANSPVEFQQKLQEMNAASWQKIKEKSQQAAPRNR